jgi:hypothetical protein
MSVGFELGPVAGEQERPVAPPVGLLRAAAVAFGAGAALLAALVGEPRFVPHLAGYVLNGLVTVGLVASFPRVDAGRRRSHYYSPRPALARVAAGLAVATVIVAGIHAWAVADWLARSR